MHFVTVKGIEQQNLQALERVRERLVKQKTQVTNQTPMTIELGQFGHYLRDTKELQNSKRRYTDVYKSSQNV